MRRTKQAFSIIIILILDAKKKIPPLSPTKKRTHNVKVRKAFVPQKIAKPPPPRRKYYGLSINHPNHAFKFVLVRLSAQQLSCKIASWFRL